MKYDVRADHVGADQCVCPFDEGFMQNIFGFLNINKPINCTSHDVIAMLRKSLGIKKIGHSGTLDPFATGVLVVGIGDATRLFEYLPRDKVYLAEITFGVGTDTDDITGKVINRSDYTPSVNETIEKLKQFTGKIKQKPPIFSAININGERAYKLARENQISTDDLKEREVEIYSITVGAYHGKPLQGISTLDLQIHCSSGTYIRSIARDLGNVLNTYGTLSKLKRIKIGSKFLIENSISPELINSSNIAEHLVVPQNILELEKLYLDSRQIDEIVHGREIKISSDFTVTINKNLQILDNNDRLIGIGLLTENYIVKPKKIFLKEKAVILSV